MALLFGELEVAAVPMPCLFLNGLSNPLNNGGRPLTKARPTDRGHFTFNIQ